MIKNKILNLILSVFAVFTTACSTSSVQNTNPTGVNLPQLISEGDYHQIIESHSQHQQVYSGLYNTVDATATILNTKVSDGQVDQMGRLYLWDQNKYTQEKVKNSEKLTKTAEFFVSFYTPERKHDDLHKNQTLWKVFLDVGGKRFDGKATKVKLLTEELQGFYPYHNRFSTPYTLTFPTAMNQIENQGPIKLTITGPVGSVSFVF